MSEAAVGAGAPNDPQGDPGPIGATGPKSPATEYLILVADETRAGTWVESEKISERGAMSAVRKYAEKNGEGRYVAVPTRSFTPVKVGAETQTKLTFS